MSKPFVSPSPFPVTSHLLHGAASTWNSLRGSHGGRTSGLAFWAGPGHSAECCSLGGKGRTTSFSLIGSRKRKERSRVSSRGFVVRSSCTGKASTGPLSWESSGSLSSSSGRYWTDPLGTALEGEQVDSAFFSWDFSTLGRFTGPWLAVEVSLPGVGA